MFGTEDFPEVLEKVKEKLRPVSQALELMDLRYKPGVRPRARLFERPPRIVVACKVVNPQTLESEYWATGELEQEIEHIATKHDLIMVRGSLIPRSDSRRTPAAIQRLSDITRFPFKNCGFLDDSTPFHELPPGKPTDVFYTMFPDYSKIHLDSLLRRMPPMFGGTGEAWRDEGEDNVPF